MATENRINHDSLTQYAICWSVKNITCDQWENLWSVLMDNQIDCFVEHTDFDDYSFVHLGHNKDFTIRFRSKTVREHAQTLTTLMK
ncbi:MAG: hypothetical protein M0R77_02565 [Gammaproteobacteria bacterium]|nr:hypothetical protein [Gammaproteobacteria bacterium]